MIKYTWLDAYWLIWVLVLFLVPELLGHFGVIPLHTLSRDTWQAERSFPLLKTLIFGFLIGLCVHLVFRANLIKAEGASIALALLVHVFWAL